MRFIQFGIRPHRLIALSGSATTILHLSLAAVALVMGGDYISSHIAGVGPETISEQMAPLWVWGALSLTGGALLAVGALNPPRLRVLQVGHVLMGSIYAALGVGELINQANNLPPAGWTEGVSFILLGVIIHMTLAKAADTAIGSQTMKG